jgi:serine/threonine-protein kinase
VDEIGVGGMASVHLGRLDGPGGFQKWVALKRIHDRLAEDEDFIGMFLDEARVAARITHANVAAVYELGVDDGVYWIAMEYLHGESLRELVHQAEQHKVPIPLEVACRIIIDAADGLHAAHELLGDNGEKLGLVHRDVTPHNLFVGYNGTTKIVDFGIAVFQSRVSRTNAGQLKGKLAYMSPEQVSGQPLDRGADIFSLGIVLWELTTGARLFLDESDLQTIVLVQACDVPKPSTRVPGYPPELESIVLKTLAKARKDRYATARELSRALQAFLAKRDTFVGNDEVATFVRQLVSDRVSKREAHLLHAREATDSIESPLLRDPRPTPRVNAIDPSAPPSTRSRTGSTQPNIGGEGVFIRTAKPAPVGNIVSVEMRVDDSQVHSRPARVTSVTSEGMHVAFIEEDDAPASSEPTSADGKHVSTLKMKSATPQQQVALPTPIMSFTPPLPPSVRAPMPPPTPAPATPFARFIVIGGVVALVVVAIVVLQLRSKAAAEASARGLVQSSTPAPVSAPVISVSIAAPLPPPPLPPPHPPVTPSAPVASASIAPKPVVLVRPKPRVIPPPSASTAEPPPPMPDEL